MNGIPEFINEVVRALGNAPGLFTDPMFLTRLVVAGIDIAEQPDDEGRRGAAQAAVLKLKEEFTK